MTLTAPGTLTPVLSSTWDQERSWTLDTYRRLAEDALAKVAHEFQPLRQVG